MDKLKIDKKGYVTFYAAAEYNGKLYIADRGNRGLLEYDLTTGETIIKNVFMAENYMNNYWSAFTYKNEIWFVPVRDYQKIAIYNVDDLNNDICEVNIRNKTYEYKTILCADKYKKLKYPSIIVDDNDIYFFPDNGTAILEYDYLNESMRYNEVCIKDSIRKLKYVKGEKIKQHLHIALSNDSKNPCMLIFNGCVETIELKLPADFFVRELFMEMKER